MGTSAVAPPPGFELEQDEVKPPAGFSLEGEQPKPPAGFQMEDTTTMANKELAKQGLSVAPPPSGFVTPKKVSRLGVDVPAGQQKNVEGALKDVYSGYAEAPVVASGVKGYPRMAGAVKEYTGTFTHPERYATGVDEARAREHAGAEFITGATEAMTPVMGVGAIAAPVRTAVGIGTGLAASYGAGKVAEAAGGSPETQELAKDVGFFLPSTLAAVSGIRGSIYGAGAKPELGGTDAWGRPITPVKGASISAFGGRVRAGVAVTPEGRGAGLRVGNTTVGIGSPEVAARAATPDPVAEAASALAQKQLTDSAASRVANGQPPVPPQPQAPPPGPSALTPKHVEALASVVRSLPEEQQPHALLEMSGTLAQWIAARGKVVDPISGKIVIAKSPEEAEKAATDIINSAIANHDKAVADAEKAANRGKPQGVSPAGADASRQPAQRNQAPPEGTRQATSKESVNGSGVAPQGSSSKSESSVQSGVRSPAHQGEILKPIVQGVPVDVVDNLAGRKSPTEVPLHDETMLAGSPSLEASKNVPVAQSAGALKGGTAIAGARPNRTGAIDVGAEGREGLPANSAIDINGSPAGNAAASVGELSKRDRGSDIRLTAAGVGAKVALPDAAGPVEERDAAVLAAERNLGVASGQGNLSEKRTKGEDIIPTVSRQSGDIHQQLLDEGLPESPRLKAPEHGEAQLGKKDEKSGRTIIQPVNDPVKAQLLATEAAPELAQRITDAIKGIPNATFQRLRPEKKEGRVAQKIEDEKEPAKTIGDFLGAQVTVKDFAAKDAVVAALQKQFEQVEPIDDYFNDSGRESKGGYRAASLQVKLSNGASGEIQVIPQDLFGNANADFIEKTHAHYAAARDAELRGDHKKAEAEKKIANDLNDQAWERFKQRNATNSLTKGSRVTFSKNGKEQSGTVKYADSQMGIVRVQPEGSRGTITLRTKDVKLSGITGNLPISETAKAAFWDEIKGKPKGHAAAASAGDKARIAIKEAGMEDMNAKRGISAEEQGAYMPDKQPLHTFNAPGLGSTITRPASELQTVADVLKIVEAKFAEEGKELPAELRAKLDSFTPEEISTLSTGNPQTPEVSSNESNEQSARPQSGEVSKAPTGVPGEGARPVSGLQEARAGGGTRGGEAAEAVKNELAPPSTSGKHYVYLAADGAPTLKVPVDYADQASQVVQRYRDRFGIASSDMKPEFGHIYTADGALVGHVSYNGRVWEGSSRDWKPGTRPIQERTALPEEKSTPPSQTASTIKESNVPESQPRRPQAATNGIEPAVSGSTLREPAGESGNASAQVQARGNEATRSERDADVRVAAENAGVLGSAEPGTQERPEGGAGGGETAELESLKKRNGIPAPGSVGEVETHRLSLAPHRFQYKLNTDAEGVGTLLKEVRKYNPDLAGTISIWTDPADGRTYIVNGHHRYELAKRTGYPKVAVRHIVAADATTARAIGALQNIAQGRGTAIDAAKFMRDSKLSAEDLKDRGISLGEATASKAVAMSKLDDSIFNKVVQGEFPMERAVAIGEATDNHAEQKAVVELIERKEQQGKKITNDTLRELVRFVKGAGQSEEQTLGLFGTESVAKSHALEKAEVSAYIKQQLAKDKKLFGFVSKGERAEELERGNNIIDVKTSKALAEAATQGEEVYNKLSERAGPISDILDDAAARIAGGENANAVKQEAYADIKTELSAALGVPEEAGLGRSRAAREAAVGAGSETASYRRQSSRQENSLSDDQLSSWAKSRTLRISDGGKQSTLFGEDEPMYKLTRLGSEGQDESQLITKAQFNGARKQFPNFDKAARAFEQGVQPVGPQTSFFETKKEREPESTGGGYGSGNLFITREDADQARKVLLAKASTLNSGLDPEAFTAMAKLGAYHFEAGAREFGKWSAEMLNQAGETVKPYLQAIYDDILDRFRPAAIWKLKSDDVISAKMKGPMSGNDLARMLRNNGIKPDEMKWTGLDDFLKDKPKVSPAQVREFLRMNDVQVQEVEHGKPKPPIPHVDPGKLTITNRGDHYLAGYEPTKMSTVIGGRTVSSEAEAREYAERYFNDVIDRKNSEATSATDTKFSNYALPGGENYRELLLTLPSAKLDPELIRVRTAREAAAKELSDWVRSEEQFTPGTKEYADAAAHYRALEKKVQDLDEQANRLSTTSPKFRSGHFDEPNVLAHVRFNDRVDTDGKKTLFLEELQSDWHQKGRREGYDNKKYQVMLPSEYASGGRIGDTFTDEAAARAVAAGHPGAWVKPITGGVPDAPFKKDWHELALKRMLRYAAEHGYEKLGWTTGEQQAERYDLSKQVEKLYWQPDEKILTAYVKGEGWKQIGSGIPESKLPDYIGKDAAEKIVRPEAKDARATEGSGLLTHSLSGDDLKVGGEGMRGFYDKIIPDFLNRYGKKWGARVGETHVPAGNSYEATPARYEGQERTLEEVHKALEVAGRHGQDIYQSPITGERQQFPINVVATSRNLADIAEAMERGLPFVDAMRSVGNDISAEILGGRMVGGRFDAVPKQERVHSIDITPAMRESVLHGQYLYAGLPLDAMVREAVAGIHKATHSEAAAELKEWLGNEVDRVKQSRELQKGLYDLEGAYAADVLRAVRLFKSMPGNAIDQEVIYHSLENPKIKLNAEQELIRDVILKPLMSQSERIYRKLSDGGIPVENYVHRVVQGKGNFIDRLLEGSKGGPGNILSKRAGATKSRSMMALEDEQGNRKLVSIKGDTVQLVQRGVNGEQLYKPAGTIETKDGEPVVSLSGKLWKLKQATTKEIEAGTDLRYYKNAAASTITSYLELRKAERAYDFLESLKSDPKFQDLAWTKGKDGTNAPPKGWKPTKLAQFQGYYFEPHQAEVLDWYWDRIHHDVNAWDKLGRVMMTSIFYNPLLHVPNVAAAWAVEGGATRLAPSNIKNAWSAGDRARRAVMELNDDYIQALEAGAPLQAYRPEADQLQKMFFEHLGDKMQEDTGFATQMKEMFGSNFNPYAISHKITWGSNDIMLLQSIYEHMGKGDSMKEAIRKATEIIPDYRLPTRMFDSKATASILSNRAVTMFMPYHYGVLKSAAKIAEGAAKGDKAAYDKLIALALITFVLYPLIDKGVRKASGQGNARMKRSGLAGLIDNVEQVVAGNKAPTQALQSVITPAVHTKTAAELFFNKDFYTGRPIYDQHAPAGKIAKQVGRKLASTIGPADAALRAYDNKHGARGKLLWQQAGVTFPNPKRH